MIGRPLPEIDTELLRGFRFTCRPDCGLCCYAEPRVEAGEQSALLQLFPGTEFRTRDRDSFLASRPDGGACQFLQERRCRAHELRPHPCREYPLTAHVGRRLQATIVLTCPGVGLEPLIRNGSGSTESPAEGLENEIEALRSRRDSGTLRRLTETARRGRRVERLLRETGRWEDDDSVRGRLGRQLPTPGEADFPVDDPPSRDLGTARLPLFFDGRAGPVALAAALGGWELFELRAEGGATPLGIVPPPSRRPSLAAGAERLLEGYLRYWLRRDAFLASVQLAMLEETEGSVSEWAAESLREIGAVALARGSVRAKLEGRDGDRLTEVDVAAGIRATDQDALDLPTWGDRF